MIWRFHVNADQRMAFWKVNLFFGQEGVGWSETYYRGDVPFGNVEDAAKILCNRRFPLLASPISMIGQRISDDQFPGDADLSLPAPVTDRVGKNLVDQIQIEPEFAWNAALVRAQSGLLYRRPLYLRGYPDEVTHPSGPASVALSNQWKTALKGFTDYLGSQGWQIKAIQKGGTTPRTPVLSWALDAQTGNIVIKTLAPLAGVNPGDTLRSYQVSGSKGFPGFWRVVTAAAPNYFLVPVGKTAASVDLVHIVNPGTIKKIVYIYPTIDSAKFLRFTHRDTGRPFDQSRGRRRVVR